MITNEPPAERPQRLELRRQPFWTTGVIILVTVIGVVGFTVLSGLLAALQAEIPPSELIGPAIVLVAALLGLGALIGWRLRVRSHPMPAIVFADDGVDLPPSLEAVRSRRIPYGSLILVGAAGRPGAASVLIETDRLVLVIPAELFVDEGGAHVLIEELNRRLRALPEWPQLEVRARKRRDLADRAMAIRPIVTQALLGLLAVFFANQALSGGLGSPFGLVQWGANVPMLVRDGETFRLVTASFLHAHLPHFGLNAAGLYFVGRLVEPMLGSVRFLVLYLLSGLAAVTASNFLSAAPLSLGASGALFGILGALAWVNIKYRSGLPLGLRQPARVWLLLLAINVVLMLVVLLVPFLGVGGIDVVAHLGGLLAGMALCAFFTRGGLEVGPPASAMAKAAAVALVLIHGVAMIEGVIYAANFDEQHRDQAAQAILSDLSYDANTLNNLAWMMVIDPQASAPTLGSAEAAARKAVELEPEQSAYRDTLATALFRRGSFDDAIDEERRAFVLRPDELMASQLARFLTARLDQDGALYLGGATRESVSLELSGEREDGEPAHMTLRVDPSLGNGVTVFATLRRGEQHLGLLHVVLGSDPEAEHRLEIGDGVGESLAGSRTRFDVALVDGAPVKVQAGKLRWKLWDHDRDVDELP